MSKISQQTIDEIKDFTLSEALKGFVTLQKAGTVLKGISPFVDEKSPSFMVSDAKNIWKCFASGKGGKDLISFLMEAENLDFPTAVTKAAKELNIFLKYEQETPQDKEKREKNEVLQSIINKANNSYIKNFQRLEADHWAKVYMTKTRGFTDEILELFDIGYAHNGNLLTPIIKNDGLLADALELGIVKQNETNEANHYDLFRDRIIFPIYNHRAYPVGFTARINPADGDGKQKYLNSVESPIFHKRNTLYGYNLSKKGIQFFDYAILVEGPTDVMRMHQVGFTNTVGTNGTALTVEQISLLKKVTKKVVIFRDNDKNESGQKAAKRDLEILLKNGLFADIIVPEEIGDDPDTIGQRMGNDSISYISALMEDAVMYLLKQKFEELTKHLNINEEGNKAKKKLILTPSIKTDFVLYTAKMMNFISESMVKDQYIKMIVAEYKDHLSLKEINETIKTLEEEAKPKVRAFFNVDEEYQLPKELIDADFTVDNFLDDIQKYGVFQAKDRIWHIVGDTAPYTFKHVSNFSFEIIQHMTDKTSKKLFRMRNVFGKEVISHDENDKFNSVIGFRNVVTNSGGNFQYKANNAQHDNIMSYLMDKMGDGIMIEKLGLLKSAGLWVWNNEILIIDTKETVPMNENGIFEHKKKHYYFPSANIVFRDKEDEYVPQKSFITIESKTDFYTLLKKIVKVHRERGMTAILFGIASFFQDIIEHHTKGFPIYFLYGDAGSGKDNIAEIIQSFIGHPQTVINLAAKSSTLTSQIRKTSQFKNGIVHFSEFKRTDELEELLKQYFDRRGREIGATRSKIATDSIRMDSTIVMTGNEYPASKAAISRTLFEEISISKHTDEETEAYNDLKEIVIAGYSKYSNQFILDRPRVEREFLKEYNLNKRHLSSLPELKDTMSRMIQNLAVLYTSYTLYCDIINFPFTKLELETHMIAMVNNMKNKIAGASPISRFWECFMACMRGNPTEIIMVHKDYKIEGNLIFIKYTQVYNIVMSKWLRTYKETIPSKTEMLELLKKDASFNSYKDNCRISNNAKVSPTSAFIFDLNKMIYIKDDMISLFELQKNHGTLFQESSDDHNEDEVPFQKKD